MERIEIPHRFRAMQKRAYRAYGLVDPNDEDDAPDLIAGLATTYSVPHLYKGRIEVLHPGVFQASLARGSTVNFQLDHDENYIFGSTDRGLALEESDLGLLFRVETRHLKNSSVLERMIDSKNRCGMSVAYRVNEEETHKVAGQDVRFILAATLHEISAVKAGALPGAFAALTNKSLVPSVRGMDKNIGFCLDRANYRIDKAMNGTARMLAKAKAAADDAAERRAETTGMSPELRDLTAGIDRILAGLAKIKV
jgi:HK97 family phage prohead protease